MIPESNARVSTATSQSLEGLISACLHLLGVSLRRLFWSRQTMICGLLVGLASVAVTAWSLRDERSPRQFIEEVVLGIQVTFLLPIMTLSYATAGIATEREEQTLVYLLVSPLPRPWIFLAKTAASLLLAVGWSLGSLFWLSWLAGQPGRETWLALWPGQLWSAGAYVALFSLFGVIFRRATMVALIYALFMETLLGNMPGIAKRLAISFYSRCLIFEAGAPFGVTPSGVGEPQLFAPIAGDTAQLVLYLLCGGLLTTALVVFWRGEYAH